MRNQKAKVKLMERKFRTILQGLRDECPTSMDLPVKVRRRKTWHKDGLLAYTTLNRDESAFLIVLFDQVKERGGDVRPVTIGEMRDNLVHEWAHAMAWAPAHPNTTDHDAAWGVAYAKAYSAVVED